MALATCAVVARAPPATTRRGATHRVGPRPVRLSNHQAQLGFCKQRRPLVLAAAGGSGPPGGSGGAIPPLVQQLVASPLYRIWLQAGVVLLLAMLVDAGFSGDWSRIGVLTTEQEQALQGVAGSVGCFHLVCGTAAAVVSGRRGENWAPRVAKVLAVGFLALLEVVVLPEDSKAAAGGQQ